jgi:hypothetical protein
MLNAKHLFRSWNILGNNRSWLKLRQSGLRICFRYGCVFSGKCYNTYTSGDDVPRVSRPFCIHRTPLAQRSGPSYLCKPGRLGTAHQKASLHDAAGFSRLADSRWFSVPRLPSSPGHVHDGVILGTMHDVIAKRSAIGLPPKRFKSL